MKISDLEKLFPDVDDDHWSIEAKRDVSVWFNDYQELVDDDPELADELDEFVIPETELELAEYWIATLSRWDDNKKWELQRLEDDLESKRGELKHMWYLLAVSYLLFGLSNLI